VASSAHEVVWIRLAGELGRVNASQLGQTLHDAVDDHRLVVVGRHGLTFTDSSGFDALIDAEDRARRLAARLVLIRGTLRSVACWS
jgi:anti-anti-sigma factor